MMFNEKNEVTKKRKKVLGTLRLKVIKNDDSHIIFVVYQKHFY